MWIFRRFIKLCTFDIPPPPLSLSLSKQKTGLQITTHPLANASNFFCGRQKLKDLIAHMGGEILSDSSGIRLRFDFTFNFHFCLHYLQPIKNFIQLDCSLDQHHTKSRKCNVEIYSGGYHEKIFFSLLLLSTLHWKCGPQNINVG